ncbi:MAG: hypothetical protein GC161_12185 [Planctomycetaceae bacterium]|nr:hypothetical protein [Planctomycetaceae bacterium]
MRIHKHILTCALLVSGAAFVASCDDDTPDRVGDSVEEALDDVEDATDEAIDEGEKIIDDVKDGAN